jgi:hypothetical protein
MELFAKKNVQNGRCSNRSTINGYKSIKKMVVANFKENPSRK